MSVAVEKPPEVPPIETVAAGCMPAWHVGELIEPPRTDWRSLTSMLGPGVLLAGSAIGAGEWLFGPAVTAQYGGTLLWLATISIVVQVFYNLEVTRYALYCGEPVFIGFFRTPPGPRFWTACYIVLFVAHIWPFMASNAAVPLAAAWLGHLPGNALVSVAGFECSEAMLVKILGFAIFFAAFIPLIFGGKVYTMLERVMALKLIVVLIFLLTVVVTIVSNANIWEIVSGFFRFGTVPIRAATVIAGRHFTLSEHDGSTTYILQGSTNGGTADITAFSVEQQGAIKRYEHARDLPPELESRRRAMIQRAESLARPGTFLVEADHASGSVSAAGTIRPDGSWQLSQAIVRDGDKQTTYQQVADLPPGFRQQVQALVANRGIERQKIWSYVRQHGGLPPLDWGILAAFAAIAGSGGLSNALLSNYARDKGWGMGYQTGAIPSAIGGRTITLSHVGKVFHLTATNLSRWRRWYRYIIRDQVCMWMVCSFVGLALPCMLSLQFIRNVPVSGNRVAAMTADGISSQFPHYAHFWWFVTLFVSFLVLAPNAMFSGDLIARLWTDLIWVGSRRARQMEEHRVNYIYYCILVIYAIWGSITLALLDPLQIAKLGAVLMNVALGFSAFHTLYVNRTLLPPPLRPNLLMQSGLVATGIYFIAITALAAWTM